MVNGTRCFTFLLSKKERVFGLRKIRFYQQSKKSSDRGFESLRTSEHIKTPFVSFLKTRMASRKIVQRIKESLYFGSRNPLPQTRPSSSTDGPFASNSTWCMSFARVLGMELKEEYHRLVASSFAKFIKGDTGERKIEFDEHLQFLEYKQKLSSYCSNAFLIPSQLFFSQNRKKHNRQGEKYLHDIFRSVRITFARSDARGDMARRAVLAIKNAVFQVYQDRTIS